VRHFGRPVQFDSLFHGKESPMRTLTLILAAALAGCAASPASPPAAPVAPVARAAPAAPTPPSLPGAATGPGGVSAETYTKARQAGYRSKVINGRTIFCRTEAGLGTRIAKESCVSSESLEESLRQAELVRDQMRRGNACGMDDCAGK
jgi:hypothetical protein